MDNRGQVYIVEDDQAMRDSLVLLLETAGYGVTAFDRAEAFLQVCAPELEGCVVLDMNMPGMGGIALYETMCQREIRLPTLFLTGYGTIPDAVKAMRRGAVDFLTKPVEGSVLLARVAQALETSREVSAQSRRARFIADRFDQLSPREREIANLIGEGLSSKEIGRLLEISYRTVDVHRRHLMSKLGAGSNLEVARLVFEAGKEADKLAP